MDCCKDTRLAFDVAVQDSLQWKARAESYKKQRDVLRRWLLVVFTDNEHLREAIAKMNEYCE